MRIDRRSTTTLLAIVAALSLTATASAATVQMERVEERDEGQTAVYGTVAIAAAAGETNTLEIGYTRGAGDEPDELLVTDATAPLVAGERCLQVNANAVRCRDAGVGDILEVAADLGDMDDRARSVVTQQLGSLAITGGP